ncbi:MAG: glycoside hydrolase family 31 protein [Capsulimonadaceae bacterium]|nr:glycoside hydrolase family 31 protein [Capsulimonadaceae bacterium]
MTVLSSLVAPGVWKLRLGEPEAAVPSALRQTNPSLDALSALGDPGSCPISTDQVGFDVSARGVRVFLPLGDEEQIYGLGLQLRGFNHRGGKRTLRVNSDPTVFLGDSHAPVPFYVSTAGYGVLVDTARYLSYYFGATRLVSAGTDQQDENRALTVSAGIPEYFTSGSQSAEIEVPVAQGVDIYVFSGPTALDAVRRYNLYSGGGPLVPRWGLGVWYRAHGKSTQAEVEALASDLRETGVPCDVIGLEPGWQTRTYSNSHVWNKTAFPNPKGLADGLASSGFRLNNWTHAFTHPESPIYEDLVPLSGDHEVWHGLVPDFTIQKTRDIYSDFHAKTHVDAGVSGYKLDECDSSDFLKAYWSFPETSRFPSGLDGEQYHSVFGLLYQETIHSIFQKRDQRAYHLVRNSHAFAASYPFVLYSDLYDHDEFIRGVPSAGFSGLLWTPELRHAVSREDLLRRLQSIVFSPMAHVNAWYIKNPPWKQYNVDSNNSGSFSPEAEELTSEARDILEWRMRFVPYLYAAFTRYRLDGTPPFRALALDWPGDERTHSIDDEYMMGDRLLVAPMVASRPERDVYLPVGAWRDFWTGDLFEGGASYHVAPDVTRIPLYVKEGSIVPLARVTPHSGDPAALRLTARVFGDGHLAAELWEDDGLTLAAGQGDANRVTISWDATRAEAVLAREGAHAGDRYDLIGTERVG